MNGDAVVKSILDSYDVLFSAEKKVANYILNNPQEVIELNVVELALKSNVSDATVIRFCKHIGCAGYHQFRIMLARSLAPEPKENERSENDTAENSIYDSCIKTIDQISKNHENASIIGKCVDLIAESDIVHVIAKGNTATLSQYFGFRLERMGIRAMYNDDPVYFINHINLASANDIVVGISKSGSSKSIIQGMELAKEKGLKTIAITRSRQSYIANIADYALISSGIKESLNYQKDYDHLNEIVIINALLHALLRAEKAANINAERLEYILSEDKL
jgi:RpiR family transcriptional regulator, carbohydrate utilization regulator